MANLKTKASNKIITILDEGNKKTHGNGGVDRVIIYKHSKDGEKFKIYIHCEGYNFQSFAKLKKWDGIKGWLHITSKQPQRDYNINVAYRQDVPAGCFDPIISDLQKLSLEF